MMIDKTTRDPHGRGKNIMARMLKLIAISAVIMPTISKQEHSRNGR